METSHTREGEECRPLSIPEISMDHGAERRTHDGGKSRNKDGNHI